MKTTDQTKIDILELCSESEHGSWEFWSGSIKTEAECEQIFQVLVYLVNEKMIYATEHRYVADKSYAPVALDEARLKDELRRSMLSNDVDSDRFYWFVATDE